MEPFIGQIQAFGFNFPPRGWALCNGQLLPIAQNQSLFSLIGTIYGGDGRTTFALPDLRGRSIVHQGTGPGLSSNNMGQRAGVESVTLTQSNMPNHSHALTNGVANVNVFTTNSPNDSTETANGENGLGTDGTMPAIYREEPTTVDKLGGVTISGATSPAGGNIPFDNRSPYLCVSVCIALVGLYPSRS